MSSHARVDPPGSPSRRDIYLARLNEALPRVRERIDRALERAGRSGPVRIVAVTKGHPADAVLAAAAAGLTDVGENRVAELEAKRSELADLEGMRWHLIGHLQRNKVRRALPLFDLIHSVDSLRLAQTLSGEAERAGREVEALVQVNVSGEETKGGLPEAEATDLLSEIVKLPKLHVRGIMTMAPFTEDEAVLRRTFRRTRELLESCARAGTGIDASDLSMGMSNDYEVAVEEGSTIVRLGTVLFGERTP